MRLSPLPTAADTLSAAAIERQPRLSLLQHGAPAALSDSRQHASRDSRQPHYATLSPFSYATVIDDFRLF